LEYNIKIKTIRNFNFGCWICFMVMQFPKR